MISLPFSCYVMLCYVTELALRKEGRKEGRGNGGVSSV